MEFQPQMAPSAVVIAPVALRSYLGAARALQRLDPDRALVELDRCESLVADRRARQFLAEIEGRRALTWLLLGREREAVQAARDGLRQSPFGAESRYVLAQVLAAHGRVEGALAQLDTLLAFQPRDADAIELRERLRRRTPSR